MNRRMRLAHCERALASTPGALDRPDDAAVAAAWWAMLRACKPQMEAHLRTYLTPEADAAERATLARCAAYPLNPANVAMLRDMALTNLKIAATWRAIVAVQAAEDSGDDRTLDAAVYELEAALAMPGDLHDHFFRCLYPYWRDCSDPAYLRFRVLVWPGDNLRQGALS